MSWLRTVQRVVISCWLIAALNQHLLLCLAAFQQKAEPASVCACPPTACMCPPTTGCEHNHPGMKDNREKRQISACHPRQHEAIYPFSWDWEVPTLTHHLAHLTSCPPFTYVDFSAANFGLQQYLSPPDKPPQTLA